MSALIVAGELGIDKKLAIKRMKSLSPATERSELIKIPSGAYVLVDSLKAAIETIKVAFETLEGRFDII